MTAAIAQQQEAALRPLKITALVGYGLGDFGCNLAFTLGSTFLLYYYTDVAGLSAAAVGTMSSFSASLTPSARLCSRPKGP